jgi:hypothetical protein
MILWMPRRARKSASSRGKGWASRSPSPDEKKVLSSGGLDPTMASGTSRTARREPPVHREHVVVYWVSSFARRSNAPAGPRTIVHPHLRDG